MLHIEFMKFCQNHWSLLYRLLGGPVLLHRFSYPYGAMKFIAALAIRILIANSRTRCHGIVKALSEDGGLHGGFL
jgi:hypothetical protein